MKGILFLRFTVLCLSVKNENDKIKRSSKTQHLKYVSSSTNQTWSSHKNI